MPRPEYRSRKKRREELPHPSPPGTGAAGKVAGTSEAATASVGLLGETARRGRPLARASTDQPHLDCPRCGSAKTRCKRSKERPQYFCASCRRCWTRGATLRRRRPKTKPHAPFAADAAASSPPPALLPPLATHQSSHAAVVAAPAAAAGFSVEPSSQGDGLEYCSLGSAFLDWIDQFLQTRMQEDFKAAFLGGGEETDGCALPPSPPDGDQEPEHKLHQQQQQQQQRQE